MPHRYEKDKPNPGPDRHPKFMAPGFRLQEHFRRHSRAPILVKGSTATDKSVDEIYSVSLECAVCVVQTIEEINAAAEWPLCTAFSVNSKDVIDLLPDHVPLRVWAINDGVLNRIIDGVNRQNPLVQNDSEAPRLP